MIYSAHDHEILESLQFLIVNHYLILIVFIVKRQWLSSAYYLIKHQYAMKENILRCFSQGIYFTSYLVTLNNTFTWPYMFFEQLSEREVVPLLPITRFVYSYYQPIEKIAFTFTRWFRTDSSEIILEATWKIWTAFGPVFPD